MSEFRGKQSHGIDHAQVPMRMIGTQRIMGEIIRVQVTPAIIMASKVVHREPGIIICI